MGNMDINSKIVSVMNNFSLSRTKTKWEVIGRLSELYLKSGNELRVEQLQEHLKEMGVDVTASYIPIEKHRAEILELIKILAIAPP